MPIYEYQCQSCRHEMEALQKMSDPKLTKCPACNAEDLKKKVSAAAFRLKGSGWYETDFKTGKKKNVAGDSASGSGSNSNSGSGGEKKGGTESSATKSNTAKASASSSKPSSTAS